MTDLKGIFTQEGDHGLYTYKHKHEKELLESAKAELAKCPTGDYQVKILDVQDITIHVIKSDEQEHFVPNAKNIYITAPSAMTSPNAEFILDLSMAIRESEQLLLGFSLPDRELDPQRHADMYHSRQLDLIVNMFKVAEEMQESYNSRVFLDKIENYGYGDLYKTYVEGVPQTELIAEYISQATNAIEEQASGN